MKPSLTSLPSLVTKGRTTSDPANTRWRQKPARITPDKLVDVPKENLNPPNESQNRKLKETINVLQTSREGKEKDTATGVPPARTDGQEPTRDTDIETLCRHTGDTDIETLNRHTGDTDISRDKSSKAASDSAPPLKPATVEPSGVEKQMANADRSAETDTVVSLESAKADPKTRRVSVINVGGHLFDKDNSSTDLILNLDRDNDLEREVYSDQEDKEPEKWEQEQKKSKYEQNKAWTPFSHFEALLPKPKQQEQKEPFQIPSFFLKKN